MSRDHTDVLIVGGGQAGAELAWSLRTRGYEGSVRLLGAESLLPYERPPLSKGVLVGTTDPGRLVLRSEAAYAAKRITVDLATSVTSVDPDAHEVVVEDGRRIGFGVMVLATGASPIAPGWSTATGALTLRTCEDVSRIRAEMGKDAVVVGGGFLGLETAASLSASGVSVTVLELADNVLAGRVSSFTARRIRDLHERHGVTLRCGVEVVSFEESGPRPCLTLVDGSTLHTDTVIVAVGATPNAELLRAAGARCLRGVVVDERCRTTLPDVYAIGDVASTVDATGREVRVESVAHALHQARNAAADIVGAELPNSRPPTFWSEQYGVRLQTVGLPVAQDLADDLVGDSSPEQFWVRRTVAGRLQSFESFGDPVEFMRASRELAKLSEVSDHA